MFLRTRPAERRKHSRAFAQPNAASFARVVDLAIMLDAAVGRDTADPTTMPVRTSHPNAVDPDGLSGRRIGLVASSGDPEVEALVDAAIEELTTSGI